MVRAPLVSRCSVCLKQSVRHIPQTADQVRKVELLLRARLGLPLTVCWRILDMTEYWLLVRLTDTSKLDNSQFLHRDVMNVRVDIPSVIRFNRLRRVVLAIGGHTTSA